MKLLKLLSCYAALVALLFLTGLTARATEVTVASRTVASYTYGGSTATLRVYASQSFFTSDGKPVVGGAAGGAGFYQSVACTVSGTTLTVPSFVIDSTTDSSVPAATYTAVIFDSKGVRRENLFTAWKVPVSLGTSVTWSQLNAYNTTRILPPDQNYYTANQVNALIAAALTTPLGATYVTQTPNSTLPGEQALSALSSGLVTVTTGTGVLSSVAYGAAGRVPASTGSGLSFAPSSYLLAPSAGLIQSSGYTEHFGTQNLLHDGATRPVLIGHGTGASQNVPTQVNHFWDATSSPGGQFGAVFQIRSAGVEGTGPTPVMFGNYKVALNASAENAPGIETDAILLAQTLVTQVNPGPAIRPDTYGLEIDINNFHSDAALMEADYAASPLNGFQVLGGGSKLGGRAATLTATSDANAWRKGLVIEDRGGRDIGLEVGPLGPGVTYADGAGHRIAGRLAGSGATMFDTDSTGIWFLRNNDVNPAGWFLRLSTGTGSTNVYAVDTNGGSIGPWFRSYSSAGFEAYKDGQFTYAPTKAVSFGNAVPGSVVGDDPTISTFSSTGVSANVYRERWMISNQSNFMRVGGAYTDSWGSGSPEGVVPATPGSGYRDTSAGKLYIKESGTGNTGWVMK